MPDQDPPLKKIPPQRKEKTVEDLLNRDGRMMRSPVLWFVLLGIPVLIGFYVAFQQGGEIRAERPVVTEYKPAEGAAAAPPPRVSPYATPGEPASIAGRLRKGSENRNVNNPAGVTGRGEEAHCNFNEWMGKVADEALQASLKSQNRPYRILPLGSVMTQDYSPGRVNFETDAGGKITRIWCG